jgi:hypothetical protein
MQQRRIDNTMTKRKKTNDVLQNPTQKTKDWAKCTHIKKAGLNSGAPEEYAVPSKIVASVVLLLS